MLKLFSTLDKFVLKNCVVPKDCNVAKIISLFKKGHRNDFVIIEALVCSMQVVRYLIESSTVS